MNLAFVGFGTVARRFLEILFHPPPEASVSSEYPRCRLIGIATASHGCAVSALGIDPVLAIEAARNGTGSLRPLHDDASGPPPETTAAFLAEVTRRWSHDLVVVENTPLGLDGGQPGVDHARQALAAGAAVITANKGPAAFAFRELLSLARRTGGMLLCEGAVLDGLPIFSLLRSCLPALRVTGFRGIVNTTTNHVLSRMESGLSLEESITEMQEAGVAEADPSHDIDGWDAAAKAAVLANVLMGADLTPHDVRRESIRAVTPQAVRHALESQKRIKVIASGRWQDGTITASVRPLALDAGDPLARLHGTAKGLELDTDRLGRIQLSKSASGVDHTAYALLCDLVEVSRLRKTSGDR